MNKQINDADSLFFKAETAEKEGDNNAARYYYMHAADCYAAEANAMQDMPNTKGGLAVAAVECFARAKLFDKAVEWARRFLAEKPAGVLAQSARRELRDMLREYETMSFSEKE